MNERLFDIDFSFKIEIIYLWIMDYCDLYLTDMNLIGVLYGGGDHTCIVPKKKCFSKVRNKALNVREILTKLDGISNFFFFKSIIHKHSIMPVISIEE